jgi:EAL domain-containing protein (putative c-di-GMP-specific phosphodiesterase class I)/GGDEF domain-containing protein
VSAGNGPAVRADSLLDALPDLVLLVRRDGTVLAQGGGRDLEELRPAPDAAGKPLEALWPGPAAELLRQLTRKSIAQRTTAEAQFADRGRELTARAAPRGPDRAICIIRASDGHPLDGAPAQSASPRPQLDRRGFMRRFKESLSWAALRETPVALAIIQIEGVADIAQVLASQVAEQVMSAAIRRLPASSPEPSGGVPPWYLGQLSEGMLALVIESADRDAIEACVAQTCRSLREPVRAGDAEFHLTPYAGVAVLGQDAASPKALMDQARAAASEARRCMSDGVQFFSDTVKLRTLARLDIARELREAIGSGDIRLRYVGRHDLRSGQLVAYVGYVHWQHPLRGEIRPAEFLRVAAATGLAAALSRAVLACLRKDFAALAARAAPDVSISFGALRHHVLHEDFGSDVARLIAEGGVPAERLELRIAEKVFSARQPARFAPLSRLGVRLVIDEVGRGTGSLDSLARAPIWGLQLDRAWVAALRSDPVARKVCRAGIGMAAALGLVPIATGVDDAAVRDALLGLGCPLGSGDLYREGESDITQPD